MNKENHIKTRNILIIWWVALFCSVLSTNVAISSDLSQSCISGSDSDAELQYDLIWSDEFNSTVLDFNKWDFRALGPRRNGINVKDTVCIDDHGHLVMTTRKAEDGQYHTAMIGSQDKFHITYGYIETRVKLQTSIGHWSAFWLQSPTISSVGNVSRNGAEIDVFEYLVREAPKVFQAVHWDGYGEDHKVIGNHSRLNAEKNWHTFALRWSPDNYIFYVDGVEIWNVDGPVSQRDQYLILSLEVGNWAGDIAQAVLPDSMLVDYVRVYSLDSTVYNTEVSDINIKPDHCQKANPIATFSPEPSNSLNGHSPVQTTESAGSKTYRQDGFISFAITIGTAGIPLFIFHIQG